MDIGGTSTDVVAANAGHFRPLTVLTRSGSVLDAASPAAFGTYYEVGIRLRDAPAPPKRCHFFPPLGNEGHHFALRHRCVVWAHRTLI